MVKVDRNYRISLKNVKNKLDIKPSDSLLLEVKDGIIIIKK